ncbi:MAG: Adventurous gliding motility protein, partial [Myxococcales bacterium]|nr:Adventurous gliding motility protein [Myxococcales bacterium]
EALRGLADAVPAGPVRAAALRRLAAHHQHKRGDSAAAATTLEAALQAHPLDYESLRALDALVGAAQPERLIDPLLRAFAAEAAGPQRLSVGLALAARLLRADRLAPARETLERILADEPAHLHALVLRAEIESRAEAWPQVVEALAAVADHPEAPPERQTEALRRMTEVQLVRLKDLASARVSADRLGTLAPDDVESMLVRLQVAARAEDHAHAAELLRRLVASPRLDEERQAALQLQLASLQEVQLDDVAAAIQTLGEIKLGSRRRDAVDRLLDLGGRTNRWDLAASALEATLDRGGDMDAGWELAIRSRLANLLEGPLARPDSAIRQYERIVAIDRGHVPALERLAELATKTSPEKAIDYHRALLSSDPTRLGSYRALRTLFAQLGEDDGAFVTEAILESLGVADEEEAYFYRQRRARLFGHVEGVLSDEEKGLLSPEAATAPFALLQVLTPLLDSVFPVDFVGYGTDEDRPAHSGPSMAAANRAARLYGVDSFRLMAVPNRIGPCVEPGTPPVLFVPGNLDDAPPREQACVFGELMARVAFDGVIGDGRRLSPISPTLLEHLLWAACEVALPDAVAPQRGRPVYEDVKRRLTAAIGTRSKAEMAMAAARLLADDSFSGATILAAMERIALRASLFSAQDPAIGIARARPAGGGGLEALPPNLRAVLPFVVSRGHLELRKRLGVGVRS